jgi:transcriptional repressor NF-X1
VECGSTDKKPSKELACDDKCLNLQRFKTLYEKSSKKLYYPGHLVKFGKLQFAFIQKVEQQLSNLLLGPEYKLTISIEKTNSGDRLRALMTLLPKHYYLDTTIFKGPKSILVMANKREDSIIPQIPLSEYLRKVARGDINLDESPFDAKITFLNLCYYDSSTDLERILGELKDDVYIDSDKSNKLKMYHSNKL